MGGQGAEIGVAKIIDLKANTPGLPTCVASNVARLYAQFGRDLEDGTRVAPDFNHAVARRRLVDRIREASHAGGLGVNPQPAE